MKKYFSNTFSERLSEELRTQGIKQKDLAQKLDISESNITNWKTGNNFPSVELLYAICEYLQVSADYLLGFDENNYGISIIKSTTSNLTEQEKEWLNLYRKLPPNTIERLITIYKAVLPDEQELFDKLKKQ